MSITNAERMRQLIDEIAAEMAGNALPSANVILPDGKKVLRENNLADKDS